MAEYIKLDAIMGYCQNQKDKTISCNDLARFPTADVIERSKVDKAIEEIESEIEKYEFNTVVESGGEKVEVTVIEKETVMKIISELISEK